MKAPKEQVIEYVEKRYLKETEKWTNWLTKHKVLRKKQETKILQKKVKMVIEYSIAFW